MAASGHDWEPVVARLYRAKRSAERAVAELDMALEVICDGQTDEFSLPAVKSAARRLDMACALLRDLTRSQLR